MCDGWKIILKSCWDDSSEKTGTHDRTIKYHSTGFECVSNVTQDFAIPLTKIAELLEDLI